MQRCVIALISTVLLLGVLADATAAQEPFRLVAPVRAPLSDDYRAPRSEYGRGNRGLEFATSPGQPVVAASSGEVLFVGTVGYRKVITLRHANGYRTTYTGLMTLGVRRGDRLTQGDVIGTSMRSLHFGLIRGSSYLDPAGFMTGGGASRVWLVPPQKTGGPGLGIGRVSRSILGSVSSGLGSGARTVVNAAGEVVGVFVVVGDGVGWIVDKSGQVISAGISRGRALLAIPLDVLEDFKELKELLPDGPLRQLRDMWNSYNEFNRSQEDCTPSGVSPPAFVQRRILIFVPGLGSKSGHPEDFDANAMGYDSRDVIHFSYKGGRIPGTGVLHDLDENEYGALDTGQDITRSAALFAELLEAVASQNPGVPVDVIAHSQGGLVARHAIQTTESLPRNLQNLVTIGTPHQGSPLAKPAVIMDRDMVLDTASRFLPVFPVPVDSPSLRQLVSDSDFLKDLAEGDMPEQVQLRSIGSRGDFTVPGSQVGVGEHGKSIVIDSGSHSSLVRHPKAIREARLAIAGMGPTCRGLFSFALDQAVGETEERLLDFGSLILIKFSNVPDPR